MSKLLELLLRYFHLGAGEGEEGGEGTGGEPGSQEEDLEALLELEGAEGGEGTGEEGEEGEEAPPKRESSALKAARERAERAEQLATAERRAREAIESQLPRQTTASDPQFDAEERELREAREAAQRSNDAGDAAYVRNLQWQINSNRQLRRMTQTADQALFQANEVRDQTAFDQLAVTMPKYFNRYKDRVEEALATMRKQGQNAPRLALIRFFIGEDIMKGGGKVKLKTKQPGSAAPGGENVVAIARGRSPTMRGDVGGKGPRTEHQKRIQRLEGKAI